MRRQQSVTRAELDLLLYDGDHGLFKLNPLIEWTTQDVTDYVRVHDVPVNALHATGYPSIGCAPCTRAVQSGEDERAGRWWWEQPESRECGLHMDSSGRLVRAAPG
jgi:phosphoadenosine phosphosulfate reductase